MATAHKAKVVAVDAAWRAEVEARARELKAGVVRPIPWATVRSRARKRARGKS